MGPEQLELGKYTQGRNEMSFISKQLKFISMVFLCGSVSSVMASSVGNINTFTAGTPAVAAQVNENFSNVSTAVDDNDSRITANGVKITDNSGAITILQEDLGTVQSDLSTKQTQVSEPCAAGSAIRAINSDGTVVCQTSGLPDGFSSFSSLSMQGDAGDCNVLKDPIKGYAYFDTTNPSCNMVMGVQLPDQTSITALNCYLWDDDGTTKSPIMKLYRAHRAASQLPEVMFTTSALTDAAQTQHVFSETNLTTGAVDNQYYNYYLVMENGGVDTSVAKLKMKFYNCYVNYSYQ